VEGRTEAPRRSASGLPSQRSRPLACAVNAVVRIEAPLLRRVPERDLICVGRIGIKSTVVCRECPRAQGGPR